MTQLHQMTQSIHQLLEAQKSQTIEAIQNYPPPIPACDSQFNYLLEKRNRLDVEINRLQRLMSDDTTTDAIIIYIQQLDYISAEAKHILYEQLEQL